MKQNAMAYAQVIIISPIQSRRSNESTNTRRYWKSSETLTSALLMVKAPFER